MLRRRKIGTVGLVSGGYVAAMWLLLLAGMLSSDRSYAVWATAGIISTLMMLVGGLLGVALLLAGLVGKDRQTLVFGAVLVAGCAMPILLLLASSSLVF